MIAGQIIGIEGKACRFVRNVEKNLIKAAFQNFMSSFMKKVDEARAEREKKGEPAPKNVANPPSFTAFSRTAGKKGSSTFDRVEECGVIVQENKRTVWVRFGTNGLTKVKKTRVQLV